MSECCTRKWSNTALGGRLHLQGSNAGLRSHVSPAVQISDFSNAIHAASVAFAKLLTITPLCGLQNFTAVPPENKLTARDPDIVRMFTKTGATRVVSTFVSRSNVD